MWHVLRVGSEQYGLPDWYELNHEILKLLAHVSLPTELDVVAEATWRFVAGRLTLEELLPKRKHLTVHQARCIQKLPSQYTVQPLCSGHIQHGLMQLRSKEKSIERHVRQVNIFLEQGAVVAWHNLSCVETLNQVIAPVSSYKLTDFASTVPIWLKILKRE